jgi:hypothetical protein
MSQRMARARARLRMVTGCTHVALCLPWVTGRETSVRPNILDSATHGSDSEVQVSGTQEPASSLGEPLYEGWRS